MTSNKLMDAAYPQESITDPDQAKAYLGTLSTHPFRPGDTSFLHPDFAVKMANAVKQARAAGLPVNISSGYRAPTTTGSNYDAAGMSLHGYGAAVDVGGIGSAGSPQAQQWAKIAQANGIYNPYGVNNPKEFNHYQLVPWKLESRPDVQKALISAGGDADKAWNAVAPVTAQPTSPSTYDSVTPAPTGSKAASKVPAIDPLAGYPTAGTGVAKGTSSVDPLADYPTAAAASPAAANAPPAAVPVKASASNDPLAAYPTASLDSSPASSATAGPITPIGVNDSVRALSTGGYIVGGLLNKADAAVNATVAPLANRFFSPQDQLQGDTWSDRYANSLRTQEGMDNKFATDHPIASTALNIAGGVAEMAPAMLAAPAAFGASETAPFVVNALTGAATGAAVGATDDVTRNGASFENARRGAFWGGVGGAAGPAIGAGVGKTVGAVSNLLNRTSPEAVNMANMLRTAGMTPEDAQATIGRLGPGATLADVHPYMTNEVQGLASKGGDATAILKNAAVTRSGGADDRIGDAATQMLGPRPDLTATKSAIEEAASAAAKPFYEAARANPVPMDATPVLQYIDGQLATAKGGVAKTLQMARNLVTKPSDLPGVTVPEDNAQGLLGARQALDDFIKRGGDADTTAGQNALRQASIVRGQIDNLVKADPNIAAGDKAFSTKIVGASDVDSGNSIFAPSTRLEDFQRSVAAASGDPDRLKAMQQGALAALHDKLGGPTGDYAAARNLFAKGTINRAKLDALFPQSGDFLNSVEGEIAKRGTDSAIKSGSQTADKLAVQQKYAAPSASPADIAPAFVGNALGGGAGALAATAAKSVYGNLTNAFTEAARNRLVNGTARGLVATGPEQERIMGQIARAYKAQPVTQGVSNLGAFGSNLLSRYPVQQGLRAKLEETPLPAQ